MALALNQTSYLPMTDSVEWIIFLGFGVVSLHILPRSTCFFIFLFFWLSGHCMCLMSLLSPDLTVWSTKHKPIHHKEFLQSSAKFKGSFSFFYNVGSPSLSQIYSKNIMSWTLLWIWVDKADHNSHNARRYYPPIHPLSIALILCQVTGVLEPTPGNSGYNARYSTLRHRQEARFKPLMLVQGDSTTQCATTPWHVIFIYRYTPNTVYFGSFSVLKYLKHMNT